MSIKISLCKNVLITGATGNIGLECVKYTVKHDVPIRWSPYTIARSGYVHKRLDLRDAKKVRIWAESDIPKFDFVILAHGTVGMLPIKTITPRKVVDTLSGNLYSSIWLITELIKNDKFHKPATVVALSSIQASQPRIGRGIYGIAKAGLEAWVRALAVEQAPWLTAIAVRLGTLITPMKGLSFTATTADVLSECMLTQRLLLPEDVTAFIYSLYDQRGLSGSTIEYTGGQHLKVWPGKTGEYIVSDIQGGVS